MSAVYDYDVIVVGGLRYDWYDTRASRPYATDSVGNRYHFPRISTMPGVNPEDPTAHFVPDQSHGYLSPHVQVAFPVTAHTNFRLSYSHQVQAPDFALVLGGINGDLTYNNQPLQLSGRIENFDAFMRAQPVQARIAVASTLINAEFSGSIGSNGSIAGPLKLGAHSIRSLAAWVGHPLPPGNGFGLMAMEGQFIATDGVYSLRQTQLRFDSMSMNADLSFDTNPEVMQIKGKVAVDRLDLHRERELRELGLEQLSHIGGEPRVVDRVREGLPGGA